MNCRISTGSKVGRFETKLEKYYTFTTDDARPTNLHRQLSGLLVLRVLELLVHNVFTILEGKYTVFFRL